MTKETHFAKLFEIIRQEIWRWSLDGAKRDECLAQLDELHKSVLDALGIEPNNDSTR